MVLWKANVDWRDRGIKDHRPVVAHAALKPVFTPGAHDLAQLGADGGDPFPKMCKGRRVKGSAGHVRGTTDKPFQAPHLLKNAQKIASQCVIPCI